MPGTRGGVAGRAPHRRRQRRDRGKRYLFNLNLDNVQDGPSRKPGLPAGRRRRRGSHQGGAGGVDRAVPAARRAGEDPDRRRSPRGRAYRSTTPTSASRRCSRPPCWPASTTSASRPPSASRGRRGSRSGRARSCRSGSPRRTCRAGGGGRSTRRTASSGPGRGCRSPPAASWACCRSCSRAGTPARRRCRTSTRRRRSRAPRTSRSSAGAVLDRCRPLPLHPLPRRHLRTYRAIRRNPLDPLRRARQGVWTRWVDMVTGSCRGTGGTLPTSNGGARNDP